MKPTIYFKSIRKAVVITVSVLYLTIAGCTKNFDSYNRNQYAATADMLKKDNLSTGTYFVQMQNNVFPIAQSPAFGDEVYQVMQNLAGDVYAGYMGASNNWNSGSNNTTYSLIPGWYGTGFQRGFLGIMPAWSSIKQAAATDNPPAFALATIVKVEGLHRLTDMYGPLPYINFGNGALQNSYDSQKDIYYKFFDELDGAIATLSDFNTKNPGATVLAKYDFIYNGNVVKWIRFANSLKLRLAMRLAYADPTKARSVAESAVMQSYGVMDNAGDIAQLNHTADLLYNHPLFIICYNFADIQMGANMESFLTGYNDPRISKYFNTASDGSYHGIRNGISINNKGDYAGGTFSKLNISANSPIVWFNPAEAYFLRAEGALRGWNMRGDAQSLYEQGVSTSFQVSGVSGGADAYLADNTSTANAYSDPKNAGNNIDQSNPVLSNVTIQYDPGASFESNLERILTQKWIAVYPDGQEAWSEFRRTGYPKIFPVVVNNSGGTINTSVQIRRLPFPNTEYQTNAPEIAKAVSLLGGSDNGGTKLWWDKK